MKRSEILSTTTRNEKVEVRKVFGRKAIVNLQKLV